MGCLHHLIEGGGDEPGQADHVGLVRLARLDDRVDAAHHAEVDHLQRNPQKSFIGSDDIASETCAISLLWRTDNQAAVHCWSVLCIASQVRRTL